MTNIKKLIPIILLFIVVGLAIVTTTLGTEGTTPIASNPDDFNVYFSKALVNGVEDQNAIYDSTAINYTKTLINIGENYTIEYDVTNASKQYDAAISVNCTAGDEYLSVTNSFDTSTLPARTTRTGTLVVKKTKSNSSINEKNYTITCELIAHAVEKDSLTETDIPTNLEGTYSIGEEITIGTEKFNIIKIEYSTVTMLAQYNLGTDYRQSEESNGVLFANNGGWAYSPGPKDIDIFLWSTNPKTYINEYVTFLQSETGDTTITGNLITLAELGTLGCTINEDYSYSDGLTCVKSSNASWLLNEQNWWIRSALPNDSIGVWWMNDNGNLYNYTFTNVYKGIRPTITISKETLDKYL